MYSCSAQSFHVYFIIKRYFDILSQMNANMAPSPTPMASQSTPSPRSTSSTPHRDSTDDPSYAKVDKSPSNPSTPALTSPAPVPKPNSELDSMLGNLESDMIGHGVSVSTKGLCGACAKPIVGQVSIVLVAVTSCNRVYNHDDVLFWQILVIL